MRNPDPQPRPLASKAPLGAPRRGPGEEYAGSDAEGREYLLVEGHVFSLRTDGGRASWVCDLVAPNRRRRRGRGSRGRRHRSGVQSP